MAYGTGKLLLLFTLVQLYEWTGALKLTHFRIPAYVQKGSSASLLCRYVLDPDESLYTLKWYKDGVEFYRYEPGAQPSQKIFPQSGVQVNLTLSNDTYVTLQPANRRYTGRYMCEVSGEAPNFDTAQANSTMHVIVLPAHGVEITTAGGVALGPPSSEGLAPTERGYRIGDVVIANCTCHRTAPVARLTWYLNDEEVSVQHLEIYTPLVEDSSYGLTSVTLGVHFSTRREHFLSARRLKLKCVAILPDERQPLFWFSRQVSLRLYDGPEVSRVVDKSRAASTADGASCCSLCCHIANWLLLAVSLYLSM